MKLRRYEWVALAGILIVAAAARIYRLNASLWYDEIDTLVNFVRLPTRELLVAFSSTNNHMFYSLQAQAAIAAFSESAWALRLPAAIFGIASLVVLWAIARRSVGRIEALVTVFLLAISYHHVWFSQNARGYTELLFWIACATLLFARGLARPSWRTWTVYAVCVAAAMYTHLSALFFIVGHAVVYGGLFLVRRWGRDESRYVRDYPGMATAKPIFGFALSAVLTLILHLPILRQVAHAVDIQTSPAMDLGPGEWLHPLRAAQEIAASLSGAGPWGPAMLIVATIAFCIGVVSLARRQPVITAAYLFHVPVTTAILLALHARIWPRFFFVDIGFVYLGVVHGTFLIAAYAAARSGLSRRWPQAGNAFTAAAVVAMTVGSLLLLARNYAHPKQDFAGAVAYVERERRPGDAVAALGVAGVMFQRSYAPQWTAIDSVADLDAMYASAPRTWVVVAFPQSPGAYAKFGATFADHFDKVAVLPGTLGNGAIWIYRSRPG